MAYDEDEYEQEPAELARRFRVAALVWVIATAVLYAVGALDPGFAIVVVVSGGVSALAIGQYWARRDD